jgi:hypothetical protein
VITSRNMVLSAALALLFAEGAVVPLAAQGIPEDQATALAKATQNPVADLVSLPFQFNFNTGGGLADRTSFTMNFQPVIPIKGLFQKWIVVARTVIPYVSVPAGSTRQSGLADIQGQFFVTPVKVGKIVWGLGPVLSVPTATAQATATGSWAIGPTALVVETAGQYVFGALVNNLWTFADDGGEPEVNQLLLQPFINFNFGKGWAVSFSPVITANWDAPAGEEWTVPVGIGFSKVAVFNSRPMSLGVSYYHNVTRPTSGAANLLRISLSLLYPSQPKPKPVRAGQE